MVGMLSFELRKSLPLATFSQRTAGFHIGQEHFTRRVKDFSRFSHKMNSAENNDVIVTILRLLSQCKTVAYVVRQLLYLITLIIMSQNDSILFLFQTDYLLFQKNIIHIL